MLRKKMKRTQSTNKSKNTTTSKQIAVEVAKMLLPHLKKQMRQIVKEEFENTMKDFLFEEFRNKGSVPKKRVQRPKQQSISENFFDDEEDDLFESVMASTNKKKRPTQQKPIKRNSENMQRVQEAKMKAKSMMDSYYRDGSVYENVDDGIVYDVESEYGDPYENINEIEDYSDVNQLIMSARDPQEEIFKEHQRTISKPLASSMSENPDELLDPASIDYSAHLGEDLNSKESRYSLDTRGLH